MRRCARVPLLAALFGCAIAQAPAILAAQVIEKGPYLQQVDTTSITVCWQTNLEGPSVVEYGTSERLGQSVSEQLTARQRGEQVWAIGGEEQLVAIHQVKIADLRPDMRYYYRVRTGDVRSEVFMFQTAVRPGTSFSFVAFGDMRPTPNHRAVVDRVMRLEPKPKFILNTGDMLSNGQRWPDWQGFFDWEAPLLAGVPLYPCLGNHENDADNYFALFNLPNNERWYSFTYGDVHCVALDANGEYRGNAGQRSWLVQDLRENYNSPYTFIFFHHPIYTCTNDLGRRMGAPDLADQWQPIFEAYEATAVFNGHDHNYQHNLVNGVHHIVTGGGGASIYPVRPRSFTIKAAPIYHVVQVDIGPDAATFKAVKADDGRVIETWSVPRRNTVSLEYTE